MFNPQSCEDQTLIEVLNKWYKEKSRPLPWRENPSLYKTVVSEFMLQQTQVKTVIPYFERWLDQFPDFNTLAQSNESDVLRAWEGLGYYKRARNLLQLAKTFISLPKTPETADQWETLPGVGPYTAAAIASISFGQPIACLDGNVIRVLARIFNRSQSFRNATSAAKLLAPVANWLIKSANPGVHNQAMMELGATVCLKNNPRCTNCPLHSFCIAGQNGTAHLIPKFHPRLTRRISVQRLFVRNENSILLFKTPHQNTRLANIYELPNTNLFDEGIDLLHPCSIKKRSLSNERITEKLYQLEPSPTLQKKIKASSDLHWIHLSNLDKVTLSGPHRRWVNELL